MMLLQAFILFLTLVFQCTTLSCYVSSHQIHIQGSDGDIKKLAENGDFNQISQN